MSTFCGFCHMWHSGSYCHPSRVAQDATVARVEQLASLVGELLEEIARIAPERSQHMWDLRTTLGVTLAPPEVPAAPLEAAAEVIRDERRGLARGEVSSSPVQIAHEVLTAAVGALTDAALLKASAPTAFAESDTEACAQFRAALLAALTEGGEG